MSYLSYYAMFCRKIKGETSIVATTLIIQNIIRIIGSMVLTRLLSASDFGIISIITSVSVAFTMVSDIGISNFIVRHKDINDENFINEVWTLKLIRSLILMSLMIIFSGPISNFLEKPDLNIAIIVSSLYFLLDGLDCLGNLLALKNRNQKLISKFDIISQINQLIIPASLALFFHNFWAIILGNVIAQAFRVWFSYKIFGISRHKLKFSRQRASELWKFSKFVTGSTMISLIIGQADKIVLVKVIPLDTFGLYVLGAGLAAVPAGLAVSYTGRVLLPRYIEAVDYSPSELKHNYYSQKNTVHLAISLGISILIGIAPLIISIMYDNRYQQSVLFFQIMLFSAYFSLGNSSIFELMICRGNTKFIMNINVVRLIYLLMFGYIMYNWRGPLGLICVVASVEFIAQIYGWISLKKIKVLSISREFIIICMAPIGFSIGYIANLFGMWLLSLIKLPQYNYFW